MQTRMLAAVLGGVLMLACGRDVADDAPANAQPGTHAAMTDEAVSGQVFVAAPPPEAQILFVGDSMPAEAERAGAILVPFSTFAVERDGIPNMLPAADAMASTLAAAGLRNAPVVIIGAPIPAGRAWAAFDYLGLGDRASLLDGGPATLAAAPSAPPAPDAPTPASSPALTDAERPALDVRVRDDIVVDAEWVRARLEDPGYILLDARPPAEYSGETPGAEVGRPGHIPGARNLFWQDLVRSPEDARLRDEEELRRRFAAAGVEPGQTIVAYCRTGGQSGFLYAVARQLGFTVRLYDGSFVDWSRTDYPVAR
jgi:thiosulfate/3-mercaptopyruvate sulfurtransferase